jgi:hypothetical protein
MPQPNSSPQISATTSFGQRIGDHAVAFGGFHEVVTTGKDDEVFAAVLLIDYRRSLAPGGQGGRKIECQRGGATSADKTASALGRS